MRYRLLGLSGFPVFKLGLRAMTFGENSSSAPRTTC